MRSIWILVVQLIQTDAFFQQLVQILNPGLRLNTKKSNSLKSDVDTSYSYEILDSFSGISKLEYNKLLNDNPYPFLHYEWLSSLENTKLADTSTGWQPVHLIARSKDDSNEIKGKLCN